MTEANTNYSIPEPVPIANDNPSIHDLVIEDMLERKQFGIEKYGTILQAGNGRESLTDAYQEILDLSFYLRQFIEEQEQVKKERDALIGALTDLVKQYMDFGNGFYFHSHIRAERRALELLEDLRLVKSDDGVHYRFIEETPVITQESKT